MCSNVPYNMQHTEGSDLIQDPQHSRDRRAPESGYQIFGFGRVPLPNLEQSLHSCSVPVRPRREEEVLATQLNSTQAPSKAAGLTSPLTVN
jgi:hypothetical protein